MKNTVGVLMPFALVIAVVVMSHAVGFRLLEPLGWCWDWCFGRRSLRGWRLVMAILYGVGLMDLIGYSILFCVVPWLRH